MKLDEVGLGPIYAALLQKQINPLKLFCKPPLLSFPASSQMASHQQRDSATGQGGKNPVAGSLDSVPVRPPGPQHRAFRHPRRLRRTHLILAPAFIVGTDTGESEGTSPRFILQDIPSRLRSMNLPEAPNGIGDHKILVASRILPGVIQIVCVSSLPLSLVEVLPPLHERMPASEKKCLWIDSLLASFPMAWRRSSPANLGEAESAMRLLPILRLAETLQHFGGKRDRAARQVFLPGWADRRQCTRPGVLIHGRKAGRLMHLDDPHHFSIAPEEEVVCCGRIAPRCPGAVRAYRIREGENPFRQEPCPFFAPAQTLKRSVLPLDLEATVGEKPSGIL